MTHFLPRDSLIFLFPSGTGSQIIILMNQNIFLLDNLLPNRSIASFLCGFAEHVREVVYAPFPPQMDLAPSTRKVLIWSEDERTSISF